MNHTRSRANRRLYTVKKRRQPARWGVALLGAMGMLGGLAAPAVMAANHSANSERGVSNTVTYSGSVTEIKGVTVQRSRAVGTLTQVPGASGCLVGVARPGCRRVRALRGPGPLLGSHAVALSPDARNLYVASRRSQAIAVFSRDLASGKLTQAPGATGCVAARGAERCGPAVGLGGPNSVTVSPDGKNVYATSAQGNSIAVFRRNARTGGLTQLSGTAGCISKLVTARCKSARALSGPDVVAVSPDGRNVYVGAFFGDAALAFSRRASTGALAQLPGRSGCISSAKGAACGHGIAFRNPEGLAVTGDGRNVYVASPLSGAVDILSRNTTTGALTQATDGTGCLASKVQAGCTPARTLRGSDAVAISPDDRTVYIAGGLSNGIAILSRSKRTGKLTQSPGPAGCVMNVKVTGCALGRPLVDPEGVTVSPDGNNVYATMYLSNALDVFDRATSTGGLTQKSDPLGCFRSSATRQCTRARGGVQGVSSSVVSPDGRYLYAVADLSDSVTVFHRVVH